jgi:Flp pilus assembly protein TadD
MTEQSDDSPIMCEREPEMDGEPRRWYEEGRRLASGGHLAQAVSALTRAIDGRGGFAEALFERGVCYALLGRRRSAIRDLQAAALLGCQEALLWSRYDFQRFDDPDTR